MRARSASKPARRSVSSSGSASKAIDHARLERHRSAIPEELTCFTIDLETVEAHAHLD